MEFLEKVEGGLFFIPLFLPSGVKNNLKSYTRYKFDPNEDYAYGRLIEVDASGGDLVEIFSYRGGFPSNADVVTDTSLLFGPIRVAMGFSKNRWRFLFADSDYDKGRDSNYSDICFLLGDESHPILWQAGSQTDLELYDTSRYSQWIVHPPTKAEEMIRLSLQ